MNLVSWVRESIWFNRKTTVAFGVAFNPISFVDEIANISGFETALFQVNSIFLESWIKILPYACFI